MNSKVLSKALLTFIALILSSYVSLSILHELTHEEGHHEDCPVCEMIATFNEIVEEGILGGGAIMVVVYMILHVANTFETPKTIVFHNTLISTHVRLNL